MVLEFVLPLFQVAMAYMPRGLPKRLDVAAKLWIIVDVFVDFSCDWSFDFYFHPLNISASVLRLAWTAEVMRHVINLTVSEVIALDYL
ncbi:hypothetical protein NC653_022932 [Populus alba x Populus x berolinensis]|uniref:Uncharacterized protein n=1 Tax=Populus alba x Populus x berolinensis TaxID=444605 RepID=A0AAD6MGJ3_9ROSI|nr:hypothetical protein NC653_022932 [Populus alba x Populus x berolinensis]